MSTAPVRSAAPVRALLFDLGGVLLDIDATRVFSRWAAHTGLPQDNLAARFSVDAAYLAFERGDITTEAYFAHLAQQLEISLPPEVWLDGWNAMLVEPRAELAAPLSALRQRYPLYLFSNTNAAHHACWQHSCATLLTNFSACFVSHDIRQRKPDVLAFAHVVGKIGEPAENILFLDDLEENVRGARAAGLQAAHVPDRHSLRAVLAALGNDG